MLVGTRTRKSLITARETKVYHQTGGGIFLRDRSTARRLSNEVSRCCN